MQITFGNLVSRKRVLLGFVLATVSLLGTSSRCEEVTLILKTLTSNHDKAGTVDPAFFAVHFLEELDEGDKKAGKKPRLKRVSEGINHRGRNRDVGQLDTYHLKLNIPVENVRRVEIGIKQGHDAWHLKGFEYVIERNGVKSRPTTIPVDRWISGDKHDGAKKGDVTYQFLYFDVKPPVFPKETSRN